MTGFLIFFCCVIYTILFTNNTEDSSLILHTCSKFLFIWYSFTTAFCIIYSLIITLGGLAAPGKKEKDIFLTFGSKCLSYSITIAVLCFLANYGIYMATDGSFRGFWGMFGYCALTSFCVSVTLPLYNGWLGYFVQFDASMTLLSKIKGKIKGKQR